MESKTCPCFSGLNYVDCCEPYHSKAKPVPTALALMRSRYAAYALGLNNYIIDTTHRKNPQYQVNRSKWQRELKKLHEATQYTGLEILNSQDQDDDTATVSFSAHMMQNNEAFVLSEESYFVKIGKQWFYHSGKAAELKQTQ